MNRIRAIRLLILATLLVLILIPASVKAEDCPPNDPSRSDCRGAAETARNPWVPIAGTVAGGVAGWVVANRGSGPKTKGEGESPKGKDPDPCQEDLDRFNQASAEAAVLRTSYQNLQSLLNTLDQQYENTRQASVWSAGIDLATLAGSIFTKPVAGFVGSQIAKQTFKQKVVEATLKSLGKEAAKTFTKTMTEQGWSWSSFPESGLKGAAKKAFQEAWKKKIVEEEMKRFVQRGIDPSGAVGKSVQEGIKSNIAGPLVDVWGQLWSLGNMAEGAISGAEKLEAIREQMSGLRKKLFEIELKLKDATDEMEISRHTLNHCRKLWAQ